MREWEIGAVENIHGALPYIRFAPILALVGVGVNRIGKLDTSVARDPIREFLHVRLIYKHDHLARVVHSTGPTPPVDLAAARNTHLVSVRARCARPDYGALMSEEVDA